MDREDYLRKYRFFSRKNLKYAFDPLTQVLNRETIVAYIKQLIKWKTPFSMYLVDVDNFKNVNDAFGHMVGDQVLVQTAEYIREKICEEGVLGRYGGDEFLFVVEGKTDYREVWEIGHNINMNICNLKFDGISGLYITITMGISRFPEDAKNYDDLLQLADKALYRGKMKGRNCFIIYLESKHKNINIKQDKSREYSSTHLCSSVFSYLTDGEELDKNIANLFKRMVAYFMFDHICIETDNGINFQTIHLLAKNKQFNHIPLETIETAMNNQGLVNISKIDALDAAVYGPFVSALKLQNINSALYCRVSAFGKNYGYIRVDMTDTARIWQAGEMDLIVIAANTLGLLLHYQNKKLTDFPSVSSVLIGGE